MFAKVKSLGLLGIDGYTVDVEADVSQGLPAFDVVGMAGTAVRESRDRVRAAIKNSGFTYPVSRITVNLAPADIKKEGSLYDLPLFISLLKASGQLNADTEGAAFIGELSLTGDIRPIHGVLPMILAARRDGVRRVFIPLQNAAEGAVVDGIDVYAVEHITLLLAHLTGNALLTPLEKAEFIPTTDDGVADFADVMGQAVPRRALEIAAAGSHNVLMVGPPGSGKSMLAKRLPSILPNLTREEALVTSAVHSIAGTLTAGKGLLTTRPFRSPHHTVSAPEEIFELYRKADIDRLMESHNVTRLHFIGVDMLSYIFDDKFDDLSDREFEEYMKFLSTLCEREDCVGMSIHMLDVFKKN